MPFQDFSQAKLITIVCQMDNLEFFTGDAFKLPFSLDSQLKEEYLLNALTLLNKHHFDNCTKYQKIINGFFNKSDIFDPKDLNGLPYLPVQTFKSLDLSSVNKDEIVRTMTSSGTSGQEVSKIYLDKRTAFNQSKVLNQIVTNFIGTKKLPFYVIDSEETIKNRLNFSARGAGILGFSRFGRGRKFLLNNDMSINLDLIDEISENSKEKILFFGFTFMIWQHFLEELNRLNLRIELPNAIVIHGGGWKKLIDLNISNQLFKDSFKNYLGINQVYNYYGMVEQTGSIFFECEHGKLHTPNFADIIIRDPITFEPLPFNSKGLIQLISLLPSSYPGHSILTEDLGTIHGEDNCHCGRMGKYFEVHGRIKNAEIRGCSDTYTNK